MAWSTTTRYPSNWKTLKKATFHRCGGQCEVITEQGTRCPNAATEIDHMTPIAEGGTHQMVNLRGVCQPHHRQKTRAETARGQARRPRERRPLEKHPGLL